MLALKSAWQWLYEEPRQRSGLRVLQFFIGFLIFFRVTTEIRFADYFWGPHGIGSGSAVSFFGRYAGQAIDRALATNIGLPILLLILFISAIGLMLGSRSRWPVIAAFVSFQILELRCSALPDGGDNITCLVLLYLILVLPPRANYRRRSLVVWLHNVGVAAITGQLLIMYTTAGLSKVMGASWQNGTSMFLISQVDAFWLPTFRDMFRNSYIVVFSTYAPIFFQLWFPIAIFSRLRPMWLLIGVSFHLAIAVMMGLVSFSSVMIGLELFLITDEEYGRALAWARRWLQVCRSLVRKRPDRAEDQAPVRDIQ